MGYQIIPDIERPDPDVIEGLRGLPTNAFAQPQTLGSQVALDPAIRPLRDDARVIGPAFTVQVYMVDHLLPLYAVTLAKAGDVLVVDAGGRTYAGVWNAAMARSAMLRGLSGVIVDGAVVDKPGLLELDLPVFARGASPVSGTWERPGSINIPVRCGGRPVFPGDIMIGDADGVVVIPRSRLAKAVEAMAAYREQLNRREDAIREGGSLFDIMGLAERMEKLHILEAEF